MLEGKPVIPVVYIATLNRLQAEAVPSLVWQEKVQCIQLTEFI